MWDIAMSGIIRKCLNNVYLIISKWHYLDVENRSYNFEKIDPSMEI